MAEAESPKKEKVVRLTPVPAVLRELYLKSGNLCAFPGCRHGIIDENGVFIAETCHIEGALDPSPRFNAESSNEDRRKFENLVLMCHQHHKVTDNVELYPVEKMRQIKTNHEAKFLRILENMAAEIYDTSKVAQPKEPTNFKRLHKVLNLPAEEIPYFDKGIPEIIAILKDLPPNTRQILKLLVDRSDDRDPGVDIFEFTEISNIGGRPTAAHVKILEKKKLVYTQVYEGDEFESSKWILSGPRTSKSGEWPVIERLKEFCKRTETPLEVLFEELDFTSLGEDS